MADMKPRAAKAPLGLLPYAGLELGAAALEHGAGKYWPFNWMDCPRDEAPVYYHAILRHAALLANGEPVDEESGIHHLGHIIAGAMIACHVLGLEYEEPGVMREHPSRKTRVNSLDALYGPRPPALPPSPFEAKEQMNTIQE